MKEHEREELEQVKAVLDDELDHLRFTGQARVLRRTHPSGLMGRIRSLWNKELELPVVPLTILIALLAGSLWIGRPRSITEVVPTSAIANRVLVKEGENYYWRDDFERMVASIATEDPR